ncbi:2-oxoglutarate and iron-dependent oxygenase domain-containing protein 1 (OGFD1) [Vairimorpha necatrix]|uniref:2-oxoglutarate and iron-dependent oxygenase domain-containing protein 1 (OGFD1) n=1 Tax=Vairimorpha necatrix TaxID=6039 RepID=A0AAX4JAU7_9MICR
MEHSNIFTKSVYSDPFFHIQIDNFLSPENLSILQSFYNSSKFNLQYTDLFKFLQTDELADNSSLDFFKNELSQIFKEFINYDFSDLYYTIFASYYRKGDFLSCHDDMVDDRLYAFTFYLDDFDSGDLVLFDNNCENEYKRIGIKKNRLVIFEVSSLSFHEVEMCKESGRKAITGWINKYNNRFNVKSEPVFYSLPDVELVPFDLSYIENDVIEYEGLEYNFESVDTKLVGKFIQRRVSKLFLDTYVALDIPGCTLVYIDAFLVDINSYILLNDFTNQIEGSLLDVFIIENHGLDMTGNIKFVNEEGVLVYTLDIKKNVMYVIRRGKMRYFIERGYSVNYKVVHMIYRQ